MKLRKFQISCPVFWGFNRYIDVEKYNNPDCNIKFVLGLDKSNVNEACKRFFYLKNLFAALIYYIKKNY